MYRPRLVILFTYKTYKTYEKNEDSLNFLVSSKRSYHVQNHDLIISYEQEGTYISGFGPCRTWVRHQNLHENSRFTPHNPTIIENRVIRMPRVPYQVKHGKGPIEVKLPPKVRLDMSYIRLPIGLVDVGFFTNKFSASGNSFESCISKNSGWILFIPLRSIRQVQRDLQSFLIAKTQVDYKSRAEVSDHFQQLPIWVRTPQTNFSNLPLRMNEVKVKTEVMDVESPPTNNKLSLTPLAIFNLMFKYTYWKRQRSCNLHS